jgi:hypothetical protein
MTLWNTANSEKERAYDEDIAQENMWYLARLAKWITLPSDPEVV